MKRNPRVNYTFPMSCFNSAIVLFQDSGTKEPKRVEIDAMTIKACLTGENQ